MSGPRVAEGWWAAFSTVVRAAVLAEYQPRSCVESVRIAVYVAAYFGLTIEPLAVAVSVHTRDNWVADDDDAGGPRPGWSVGTPGDGAMNGNRWSGHLVALADERRLLLDISADQFSRPAKGLHVPGPITMPLGADDDLQEGIAAVTGPGGGFVYFVRASGDEAWRNFPTWRGAPARARRVAGSAIRGLRHTSPYPEGARR